MSENNEKPVAGERKPSLREVLKPAELIGIAAILAVFTGLTVLLSTREILLTVVFTGIVFIVALVVIALFALGMKPTSAEKEDISEQDQEAVLRRSEREAQAKKQAKTQAKEAKAAREHAAGSAPAADSTSPADPKAEDRTDESGDQV